MCNVHQGKSLMTKCFDKCLFAESRRAFLQSLSVDSRVRATTASLLPLLLQLIYIPLRQVFGQDKPLKAGKKLPFFTHV